MIYHYMGAEVKIIGLKKKQVVEVETIGTPYKSEHHISELKADDGVQEINKAIEILDANKTFWNP